jgi:uncharacterized protein (DUF58 family)
MAQLSDILQAEELTPLQHLQLYARSVVEGITTGQHASPHKGFSVEFRQHRPYVQGDEIKRLDWKIFGRSDRFYIREYEEETNLRCTMLLDASGSMGYEGKHGVKLDYGIKLAATLAYLLMSQQDAVGLITFDREVREFIPQRSRLSHLHYLLDALVKTKPGAETSLASVLEGVAQRVQRRGLVILISDLFDSAAEVLKAIGVLRRLGHEVIVFQIWDADELEFKFGQWSRFENPESSEDFLLLDPATVRASYLQNLQVFRQELADGCKKNATDLLMLRTDEPMSVTLRQYLTTRMRR